MSKSALGSNSASDVIYIDSSSSECEDIEVDCEKTVKSSTDQSTDNHISLEDKVKNAKQLMDKFLEICKPYVVQKKLFNFEKLLSFFTKLFYESSQSYTSSKEFSNLVNKLTDQITNNVEKTACVYIQELQKELKNQVPVVLKKRKVELNKGLEVTSKKSKLNEPLSNTTSAKSVLLKDTVDDKKANNKTTILKEKTPRKIIPTKVEIESNISSKITQPEKLDASDKDVDEDKPSTSSNLPTQNNVDEDDGKEKTNGEKEDDEKQKIDHKVERLEKYLEMLSKEIEQLEECELTYHDMKGNSAYIRLEALKKQAVYVFERICKLKKCSKKTGREVEKLIRITASRFPEINNKMQKYVNKSKKFPDYFAVTYLVKKANKQHNLNLTDVQINKISLETFENVGRLLKERRYQDFISNIGCHLTDNLDDDPAEVNQDLNNKLNENKVRGKEALNSVFEKYACMDETSSSSTKSSMKSDVVTQSKSKLNASSYTTDSSSDQESTDFSDDD